MKYFKGLDTFRAFAVLFVIIQHWGPPFSVATSAGKFTRDILIPDGGAGVYMFFVLSGFLITSILLNARIEGGDTGRLLIARNFFTRRVLRIFPLYYLVLAILLAVNYYPDLPEHIWYFVTYTSNINCYTGNTMGPFSQAWTLGIEEQFYLIWPWLILFVNKRYLHYVFVVSILAGIATTWWQVKFDNHMIPFLPWNCLDAFALGGYYAYARLNTTYCLKFEQLVKKLVPAVLVLYLLRKIAIYNGDVYYLISIKKFVDSFLALWIVILIVNTRSPVVKKYLLENPLLTFAGRISYCIYLIHPYATEYNDSIRLYINRITGNAHLISIITSPFFFFCLNLAMVATISALSYYCIEKPILSLKKGLVNP